MLGDSSFFAFRVWSQEFPPADHDVRLQQNFTGLGLTGTSSLAAAGQDIVGALGAEYTSGRARLEEAARTLPGIRRDNGWLVSVHGFDYNVDAFEIGTRWTRSPRSTRSGR